MNDGDRALFESMSNLIAAQAKTIGRLADLLYPTEEEERPVRNMQTGAHI